MNFQELGLTLQQERESRGLTIKEVMESTKISRVNLVALESGDRATLPHPVYTRGFVKSYARLLGLDADELSMVVDREYQLEEPDAGKFSYDVSPHAEKAFHDGDAPVVRKRSVWPSILLVLVLGCAAVILVLHLNKGDVKEVVQPAASVETPAELAPPADVVEPDAAQPDEATVGDDAAASEATAEPEAVPVVAPQPGEQEQAVPAVTPQPAEPAPKQGASGQTEQPDQAGAALPSKPERVEAEASDSREASTESAKYAHVLVIRATTDKGCWIGVWRGDETVLARDFVLTKGEPLRLMFNSPRRIRIGNASGVTVTYNGAPYSLDQAKGNIQTLLFGM